LPGGSPDAGLAQVFPLAIKGLGLAKAVPGHSLSNGQKKVPMRLLFRDIVCSFGYLAS